MPVSRPRIRLIVAGAAVIGLQRLELVSSPEALRAAVTCSPRAANYEIGAGVEVLVDGVLMLRGPIHTVEPIRRISRRYLAESLASQTLRGLVDDPVGPFGWRLEQSSVIARELLAPLAIDVDALPPAQLRWSSSEVPRRWALDAFLQTASAAAGVEVRHAIKPDGTVALGPIAKLRSSSGVSLRTGETIITRRGDRYVTRAVPAGWNTTVDVDGAEMICSYARLDVRAGRHRSRLVLEEAA